MGIIEFICEIFRAMIASDAFKLSIFTLPFLSCGFAGALGGYIGAIIFCFFVLCCIYDPVYAIFTEEKAEKIIKTLAVILIIWPGGTVCIVSLGMAFYATIIFFVIWIKAIFSGESIGTSDDEDLSEESKLRENRVIIGYNQIDGNNWNVSFGRDSDDKITSAYICGEHYDVRDLGNGHYQIGSWQYDDKP